MKKLLYDKKYLISKLQYEVNSAILTFENHSSDNGFFGDTLKEVIEDMNCREYEPIGISLNAPFPCTISSQAIAFAFKGNDKVRWVHMPETYWFHLLSEEYGRHEADKIITSISKK